MSDADDKTKMTAAGRKQSAQINVDDLELQGAGYTREMPRRFTSSLGSGSFSRNFSQLASSREM